MFKKVMPALLLFITPLFFAVWTLNFFTFNKQTWVILSALIMLILAAIELIKTKRWPHQASLFTLALVVFAAAVSVSSLLSQEAKVESILGKGMALVALSVVAYLISSQPPKQTHLKWALSSLIGAGTMLALHGILQLVVLTNLTRLPAWMQSLSFTPAGSPLILLLTLAITTVTALAWAIQAKDALGKTVLFAVAGVQLAAVVTYAFVLAQGQISIQILPLKAGWELALDALKNLRALFLGVGLANFSVLFTQAKPTFLAQSAQWTTVFQTSSNEILYLLSTTGLIGVTSFIFLNLTVIKASRQLKPSILTKTLQIALYTAMASFIFAPANIVTYTILFVLAGIVVAQASNTQQKEITLSQQQSVLIAASLGFVILIVAGFNYRVYGAEVAMRQAQVALSQNDANTVYTQHIRAIQLMPQVTAYRVSFSQINMTLAASLSQNTAEETADAQTAQLTDPQREQITAFIQRAIEQGQVATQLRPSLYSTWQNLGTIYRNLINVAKGAEDYALRYFEQTALTDPANPIFRLEYGGLFYQLSQLTDEAEAKANLLDQAIQQFQIAINLRPTYANAHYNLANAYDDKGSYRLAYQAMTQVLANLDPESADYQQAQQELLVLEKKLPQDNQAETEDSASDSSSSVLQEPKPLPSPLPGGPVDLPSSLKQIDQSLAPSPPSATTTPPTPTPTFTPSASPAAGSPATPDTTQQ